MTEQKKLYKNSFHKQNKFKTCYIMTQQKELYIKTYFINKTIFIILF